MKKRFARLVALDQMLAWADAGEHESSGRNRSPLIDEINRAAGVPLGSPYCAAAIHYAFQKAGITDFGGPHDASVGYVEEWAREHGYLKTRPFRGDAFCWQLDGDGWPDHAGMAVKVRSWGGVLFTVDTVEANTSSGNAGSQDDGGGFYRRRRTFRRGRVLFVRDPRKARRDPFRRTPNRKPKPARPKGAPKRIPAWAWRLHAWYLTKPADRGPRPADAPARIPAWFWAWRLWRLALAKGARR